jgi:nitrite reductase (NADH) small subunit
MARPSPGRTDPGVRVGALADFPENEVRLVDVEGRGIGIVRTAEAVYAVRNVCPHQGAPICRGTFGGTVLPSRPGTREYGLDNRILRCPWHGWEFDVASGEALFGISDRRLVTYGVEVRDGDVFVLLRPRPAVAAG